MTAQLLSSKFEIASASLLRNARANASSAAIAFSVVGPAGFSSPAAADISTSTRIGKIKITSIIEYPCDRIVDLLGFSTSEVTGLCLAFPLHNRCSRSIRPFANSNYELGDGLRTALKLWIQGDRRVGQICTPGGFVCQWKVEHQMRYVVPKGIVKVACPRHHVRHRARLRCRQLFVFESGPDAVDHLSFGHP